MRHKLRSWRIDWLVLLIACTAVFWGSGFGPQAAGCGRTDGHALPGTQGGIAGWTRWGATTRTRYSPARVWRRSSNLVTAPTSCTEESSRYRATCRLRAGPTSGTLTRSTVTSSTPIKVPAPETSKMFLVTTPSGNSFEYVHTLVPGELYNNSFAAISPDTQWMVAGEWGTMSHLQIYPTPLLNHQTPSDGGSLQLAGYIKLDHKVNDIQGCDFVTPVRLICASDDDSRTLFPNEKPLLEIDLPRSLHGTSVKGHVVDLGSIPQESSCSGTFEAEGVDFDASTGILRVEIIQPGACILTTTVYEYKPAGGRQLRTDVQRLFWTGPGARPRPARCP